MDRKIYVASSWKNDFQPTVVKALRDVGHEVYDFRNPPDFDTGFDWSMIDSNYKNWTFAQYKEALMHARSQEGYDSDRAGMDWADTCVLVLPAGASAHSEAAFMAGEGKDSYILMDGTLPVDNPELMYKLYTDVFGSIPELLTPKESIWD